VRFHLTPEQVAIQDAVAGTLRDVWPMERLHAFADGDADHDPESWSALMALGVAGLMLGEAEGGAGLGLLEAALVCEAAGRSAVPGPFPAQMLAAMAVARSANPDVQAHLGELVSGEAVATLAFGGDWLPQSWTATPASGEVRFVEAARAATHFLLGTAGGGLALVEAGDGVSITPIRSTDRSRPLSTVRFDNARSVTLFEPGDPFVARLFDAALVLTAADALGGSAHCTDLSVSYAKDRVQFGQPIGRFQALKLQLAHMALDVEPAHALVWYAAYAWDAGLDDAPRAAAMAKAHLCDVYVRTTRAAVAAHGGIGYTWEYGLNYWFRRAMADRALYGAPAVHRARAADMAGW